MSIGGTDGRNVRRVGDDDIARLIGTDRVQQRQRRVLAIVLRHQQRLARACELHIRLCNVEPRSGAGFELVLRRLQQPREERDVRLPRRDLRLRALHHQIQARHRGGDVVLRLLTLKTSRVRGTLQRLIPPQRRYVEHLHGGGELGIGHVERPDDGWKTRQRESKRGQVDRLVVAHQLRISLRQQRVQRLGARNPRQLLIRARQLRLRARAEGPADGVAEREPERLRLSSCADGNGEKKKRKSFRQHVQNCLAVRLQ